MEHQRSKAGNLCTRIPSELGSVYDWALLGFAAVACIIFLLGNGVVFWNRRRRYFQSHGGAWLILGCSFGGLMWIMSAFAVNGHFKRVGLLGYCKFWTLWLQFTFGWAIWFSAIILRLHNISLFTNRNSRNQIFFPAYLAISWVLGVVFSSTLALTTMDIFDLCNEAGCTLNAASRVLAWVTMLAPYYIGTVCLLVRLRNELREPILAAEYSYTFEFFVMACIIAVLVWVTVLSEGHRKTSGRCFLTFCQCALVFCNFWGKFGRPIYLCVFKPDEMNNLEAELARSAGSLEALEAVYRQRTMHVPSSEGAALERLTRAAEELEIYKAQIRELEVRKAELLGLLELRQRLSSTMEIERQNQRL